MAPVEVGLKTLTREGAVLPQGDTEGGRQVGTDIVMTLSSPLCDCDLFD